MTSTCPHPSGHTEIFREPGGSEHLFTAVPKTIFRMLPQLSKHKADLLVVLALAEHRNERTGLICPSYETLAAETGMQRRTIWKSLKRLSDLNLISRKRIRHGKSFFIHYAFVVDAWEDRRKKDRDPNLTGVPTTPVKNGGTGVPSARSQAYPAHVTGVVGARSQAYSLRREQDVLNKKKEEDFCIETNTQSPTSGDEGSGDRGEPPAVCVVQDHRTGEEADRTHKLSIDDLITTEPTPKYGEREKYARLPDAVRAAIEARPANAHLLSIRCRCGEDSAQWAAVLRGFLRDARADGWQWSDEAGEWQHEPTSDRDEALTGQGRSGHTRPRPRDDFDPAEQERGLAHDERRPADT